MLARPRATLCQTDKLARGSLDHPVARRAFAAQARAVLPGST
jgi:hypothetical protein